MPSPDPVNHIFIDFENVQKIDLDGFGGKMVKVTLLLGEKQKRLEARLVEQLLEHAANVQFVRLHSSGKNALDFTLAYYVGRAVISDPAGSFHIISRDKGFDPLIKHLLQNRVHVTRYDSLEHVPFLVTNAARSAENDRIADVIALLKGLLPGQRPRSRTKLLGLLRGRYPKLLDVEGNEIVTELEHQRLITIDAKNAVTYHLDPSPIR